MRVVKVRAWKSHEYPGVRYIGRAFAGWPESPFHNPFHVGRDGTRAEVLAKFIEYWYAPEQAALRMAALQFSENEILGCWCRPLSCHGDIIVGYVQWKRQEERCKDRLLF